jgi:DNA-binding MarR family transcriptional regulator
MKTLTERVVEPPAPLLSEQAAEVERLLPVVMRRLFTLQDDNTVSELPLAQLRICTILQAGPRSMTALGEELGISVSAVTQIADRLERAGLVERALESEDRRMKLLRLTGCGADLMRRRREMSVSRVEEVLERLDPAEREDSLRALRALLAASEKEC